MKTENTKYKDSASRAQKCACTNSAEALPILERKFKDSGIPWIGMIPEDWSVEPIKHKYKIVAGSTPKSDNIENWDGNISWITPADYKTEQIYVYRGKRNLSQKGYESCSAILLPPGCLIFSKRAPIGLVAINSLELCTNQGCLGCIPNNDVNTKFVYYSTSIFSEQFELYGSGTTFKEISANNFANFRLALPPLPTQQRIADFLDRKCAEIDELAALQETMIAELKRYKQSVITEAVTGKLRVESGKMRVESGKLKDESGKVKDSGVEWIGEIPEGWEVCRLKQVTSKIGSGSTPTGGSNVYSKEGVKFIRSQNVYCEGFNLDDIVFISSEIDEMMKNTRVQINDILFNITGGSIGRCRFVDNTLGPANVNQHVCIIRPKNIQTKFLFYYLQSSIGQNQVQVLQTGGNREGLSASAFGLFKILLPPLTEQQAIADYLDKKCSEIDELIAIKQQKVEQLKEYKKSVIFEYVTGKKEVKE